MKILKIISAKINLRKTETKIFLLAVCIFLLALHLYYGWYEADKYNNYYSVFDLFITITLGFMIYIWIYMAPKFKTKIEDDLKTAFSHEAYERSYRQFLLNISFSKKEYEVCLESENYHTGSGNSLKCNYNYHRMFKRIYFFVWMAITIGLTAGLIILGLTEISIPYLIGLINAILFLITMLLNCISYYNCFAYIYFLRTVSHKKVEEWDFDKCIQARQRVSEN